MSVPPYREDPEEVRPYFRKLRLLQEKLGEIRFRGWSCANSRWE
jgi:hypothetical protein